MAVRHLLALGILVYAAAVSQQAQIGGESINKVGGSFGGAPTQEPTFYTRVTRDRQRSFHEEPPREGPDGHEDASRFFYTRVSRRPPSSATGKVFSGRLCQPASGVKGPLRRVLTALLCAENGRGRVGKGNGGKDEASSAVLKKNPGRMREKRAWDGFGSDGGLMGSKHFLVLRKYV